MHQVVALQKLNEIGFKIADQRAYLLIFKIQENLYKLKICASKEMVI
jgi:hypothetical protein